MGYLLVLTDILQTEPDSTDQNSKSVRQCFNLCVIYFNRHKLWCNTVSVLEPQTVYNRWLLDSPLSSLSIMKADISYRDQNFFFFFQLLLIWVTTKPHLPPSLLITSILFCHLKYYIIYTSMHLSSANSTVSTDTHTHTCNGGSHC